MYQHVSRQEEEHCLCCSEYITFLKKVLVLKETAVCGKTRDVAFSSVGVVLCSLSVISLLL